MERPTREPDSESKPEHKGITSEGEYLVLYCCDEIFMKNNSTDEFDIESIELKTGGKTDENRARVFEDKTDVDEIKSELEHLQLHETPIERDITDTHQYQSSDEMIEREHGLQAMLVLAREHTRPLSLDAQAIADNIPIHDNSSQSLRLKKLLRDNVVEDIPHSRAQVCFNKCVEFFYCFLL